MSWESFRTASRIWRTNADTGILPGSEHSPHGNGVHGLAENIYFECRKRAAKANDRLSSRAGAAEYLGISESSLAHYELGITKCVPPDVVVLMAELYRAPELRNRYCLEECPVGKNFCIAAEEAPVERTAVRLLSSLKPGRLSECAEIILRVAEDGKITAEEARELEPVVEALDRLTYAASELKILVEKHRNDG